MGFSSPSKFEFLLNSFFFKRAHSEDKVVEFESRPSPSLVQLPVGIVVGSIKEKLPVTEYGCRKKEGGGAGGDSTSCAICLKWMREGDQVRELCNCCHLFHKECIDSWIDQAHVTCPLCRSKLLPGDLNGEEFVSGGDPWRRERMIYLFGEDFVFQ